MHHYTFFEILGLVNGSLLMLNPGIVVPSARPLLSICLVESNTGWE